MLEFGDARWTFLFQHFMSLLLQRPTGGTSVPCGSSPLLISDTGYHGDTKALCVLAWDISNNSFKIKMHVYSF